MLEWITSPARVGAAFGLVSAYALMCAGIAWRHQRHRKQWAGDGNASSDVLVVYASQTGQAEALAQHTMQTLEQAGVRVCLLPIRQLQPAHLERHTRSLWLLSTTGEGDAPDAALPFMQQVYGQPLALRQHHASVLALGDSSYQQFCAFGMQVHAWLQQEVVQADVVCVDRMALAALAQWQQILTAIAPQSQWPVQPSQPQPWVLQARRHVNPGSLGQPVYVLELVPQEGVLPAWEAGDIAQIYVPSDPQHPRDYSIASIPQDGALQLWVRQAQRADGAWGIASHWLGRELQVGQPVHVQLRAHTSFRLHANAQRPLILIGNGTGLAGLLSLLKARMSQGAYAQWLIWGERQAHCDAWCDAQLQTWLHSGQLERLDYAWSRDEGSQRYVQDVLRAHSQQVQDWVARGVAIYVCGSRQGMGQGVHAALQEILGAEQLQMLQAEQRYCRDVY